MDNYKKILESVHAFFIFRRQSASPFELAHTDLSFLEEKIGHRLPGDYRSFLTEFGFYGLSVYFENDRSKNGGMGFFLGEFPKSVEGFEKESSMTIIGNLEFCREYGLPGQLIPIGSDGSVSYICLALEGEQKGAVYFWDRIESPNWSDYKGVWKVADDFDAFMNVLVEG